MACFVLECCGLTQHSKDYGVLFSLFARFGQPALLHAPPALDEAGFLRHSMQRSSLHIWQ